MGKKTVFGKKTVWSEVLWGHPNEFILQWKSLVRRVHTTTLKKRKQGQVENNRWNKESGAR